MRYDLKPILVMFETNFVFGEILPKNHNSQKKPVSRNKVVEEKSVWSNIFKLVINCDL